MSRTEGVRREPLLVLYDGDCAFCHRGVLFIHARDARDRFRFARLQSEVGRRLLLGHGLDPDALESVVLLEGGRAHVRSTAALRAAMRLRAPWPLVAVLLLVPRALRDAAYDWVARRRHRLARGERCELPGPALRAKMVDEA